ncbi:hypothetical protein QNI19_28945 [Cytophagaceae bacterium DM2B3-1]|uniref:TonB-dependent receptor n=1 Tax=Xanthocytophaga flava TaxID=3048013 RepID=A0ABT7CTC8_9BACT|nr:hypothetical protein [Xanthocytophaga flavus]MDJ1496999.1 hypothetical protein [Xanthocytophaga flavus]
MHILKMIPQSTLPKCSKAILTGALLLPVIVFAQGGKPVKKGQIESEEIVIEKSRAITLSEAERNFEKVTITAKKPDASTQPFQFTDRNLRLADLNTKFRILQMPQEPARDITGNYLKFGIGNYSNLYAEAFLGAKQNQTFSWNLRAKNQTFGTGPVYKGNSGTQENFLGGNIKLFTSALTASAALEYNRDRYYFYGTQDERDRKDIKQVFSTIALKTSFTNNNVESPLDYKLNFNVSNISDSYDAGEFEAAINLAAKYKITEELSFLAPTDMYFTRLKDSASVSRNLFRIKPQIQYKGETFSITAGLNVVTQNDTTDALSKVNLYPVAEAQVTIGDAFTVFGGISGDMQRNYFRQLANENPYLNSRVKIFNTSKSSEIYGGIKRQLGGALSFDVRTSYARYKNMYFYMNNSTDTSRFDLVYNPDGTTVLNLSAEVAYDAGKRFRIAGKADFFKYNVKNVEQAWHRPTFTATVIGRFAATENVFLNTEIYYLGGIQAKNPVTARAVQLDPIADINLKGEYIFLEKFSAYLSLNNLLSTHYQRFLNYSNRGFTLVLGATYSF